MLLYAITRVLKPAKVEHENDFFQCTLTELPAKVVASEANAAANALMTFAGPSLMKKPM